MHIAPFLTSPSLPRPSGGPRLVPAALAAALFLAACSSPPAPAGPTPDEASHVAEDATEEAKAPAVVIIAIDGLRPADVARADTPNLDRLAEDGAFTPEARAVMPTITRTNFVTFATGAYADEHGIIGGRYLDEDWEERDTDGPTLEEAQESIPVPTIFEVAEAEGMRAGMLAMKGYELVGARGASVQRGGAELFPDELWTGRYDPEDGGSAEEAVRLRLRKNNLIVDELEAVVADEPLDLILVNLGATDYVAHMQGPDSDHYLRAIEASDALIPRIEAIVATAHPDRDWHVIVGTDHGFSQTGRENLVVPHLEGVFEVEELDAAGIEHRIYERGGRAAELYVRDPDQVARSAEILADLPWVRRIYGDEGVAGRAGSYDDLRVDYPGRRGSLYIITDPSHAFAYPNLGQHGSDDPEDLVIPIWLAGSRVAGADLDLATASNADIGPTALDLLGLDPKEALRGSGRSLLRTEGENAREGRADPDGRAARSGGDEPPPAAGGSDESDPVVGELDRADIHGSIRRELPRIRYCYERELSIHPDLEGTVITEFRIGSDGRVVSAEASGMGDGNVAACVAEAVESIRFPEFEGGGVVDVRYPFAFAPAAADDQEPAAGDEPAAAD